LLLRIDEAGDVVWRRELGGSGDELLWRVLPDGDGGFVCVGQTSSAGNGGYDGWLLRIDAQGATTWERTYGTAGDEWLTSFTAAREGWLAVGQTDGRGAGGLDAFVVRTDRDGRELASWSSGTRAYERAFAIAALDGGDCVIAGMAGQTKETCDAFVQRMTADGAVVWNKTFARPGFGVAHDVLLRSDGALDVYGYCYVDAARDCDAFAARMTLDGGVVDEQLFGSEDNDRALHARAFDGAGAVLVGHSQLRSAKTGEDGWELAVYVLDGGNRPLWSGRFGGAGVEFGRGIAGTARDTWIVGHTTRERGDESNVLLIRLDASGVAGS
jgi:hypothetical protein